MNPRSAAPVCTRWLALLIALAPLAAAAQPHAVGLHRVFEKPLENDKAYANKFTGVALRCTYTAPSGRAVDFAGFFDGDGRGGGDATTGSVWKLRFLPDELGEWSYKWSWSDGTPGGEGRFDCVAEGAGKGVLRAYGENPRWFAYNGTEPVWIKSYYETGHGSIAQPFDWITANVYQPLIDRGYNHLQVNWLMSLCCFGQYYLDGPEPSTQDLALYQDGRVESTMNLDVWRRMERHLGWLNDRNVGVHMFLGFEGRKNDGPKWDNLSDDAKDFYVRYSVARLAPYANLAGWNFVWEDPGDTESRELGWARLVQKHDVFDHLRTYEDEMPRDNEYQRPEYNFAAIENHRIAAPQKPLDLPYRKTPWTHHQACLIGYVPGKPVYMSEGNALWRRYWAERTGATQDDLRRAAWGCATAGASFCWNGHAKEYELAVRGPEGIPFYGADNPYTASAGYIDVLSDVMNQRVDFHRMRPDDSLLSGHDPFRVWCLAEPGKQYLVFATAGEPFQLTLAPGDYPSRVWVDAKTGETTAAPEGEEVPMPALTDDDDKPAEGASRRRFTPPGADTDWVLILRAG